MIIIELPEELLYSVITKLEWYYFFQKYMLISSNIKKIITDRYRKSIIEKMFLRCNLYMNLKLFDTEETIINLFHKDELKLLIKYIKYKLNN